MNNLRRMDLNLLLTLDALLAEHNVTRAAQRLNLSQPSVSVQLAKLRDAFGDPLLLPGPRGMRPTARAEALRQPLRQALEALRLAVEDEAPFDPAETRQAWRLSASDYGTSTIVLPTLRRLREAAPGSRLAILAQQPARLARQAEEGEIDLAFHVSDEAPEGLRRRVLFTERYRLVARAGHPRLAGPPSLEQFCALEHLVVSPDGGGFRAGTDRALAALGLQRRVVLSSPNFLAALAAVAGSDLVAMLPERLVRPSPNLQVLEAPVEVPGFEMSMLWHERLHRDPAHRWLREQVVVAVSG